MMHQVYSRLEASAEPKRTPMKTARTERTEFQTSEKREEMKLYVFSRLIHFWFHRAAQIGSDSARFIAASTIYTLFLNYIFLLYILIANCLRHTTICK